jgi:low affinity Fe/Cu permease
MARQHERSGKASARAAKAGHAKSNGQHRDQDSKHRLGWFTWFAHEIARLTGKPVAFIIATLIVVIWAVTGPIFHYSDTWQLVINTGTTIVTFLMVFLIQNTQNRDTMALQVKLAELIIAVHGATNKVAAAEDMCEEDLEALHQAYRQRADETLDSLNERRAVRR